MSPVTIGITSAFFSKIKNIPQIFWIQDLWPDTLVALNILKKNWQINLFKFLVNWIYSRCDLILAQSKNILKEIKNTPSVKDNVYITFQLGVNLIYFQKLLNPLLKLNQRYFYNYICWEYWRSSRFPKFNKSSSVYDI